MTKLDLADSALPTPADRFGDAGTRAPRITDVREMTAGLGDLRRGDFDSA